MARNLKQLPTLQAIVVVSHREALIEVRSRGGEAADWRRSEARAGQRARIDALVCDLDVDSIRSAAGEPR